MANYWVNLQGHDDSHPTKGVLQECWENGRNQRDNFGRVGNNIVKEFGVFDLRISPSVVYPVITPWMIIWPNIDWYLLEVKRKEKDSFDSISAFNYHMKEYSHYIQINMVGAKKPETGVTGFGVAKELESGHVKFL